MVQFVSEEKVFCRRLCLLPPLPLSSSSSSSSSSLDFFFLRLSRALMLTSFCSFQHILSHFHTREQRHHHHLVSLFIRHLRTPASLFWEKMFHKTIPRRRVVRVGGNKSDIKFPHNYLVDILRSFGRFFFGFAWFSGMLVLLLFVMHSWTISDRYLVGKFTLVHTHTRYQEMYACFFLSHTIFIHGQEFLSSAKLNSCMLSHI